MTSGNSTLTRRLRSIGPSRAILFFLIVLYIAIFTALAFGQHAGMRTHKADLGQIDQAIWNSSRGRFVEMTDNGYLSSRLIDHVEPILALISPVYWLWNDVRAILLLQVIFVAVGAWILYELALVQLQALLSADDRAKVWLAEPVRRLAGVVALALGAAYLLAPQLQSAVLTEFHAIPLATPLILWAFWAIATRRWAHFAVATILVASVKEEAALLAAGLGVWAMWRIVWEHWAKDTERDELSWAPLLLAAAVSLATLAWFAIATFVIVPAHAADVYGVAESGYFQRYGALGDSPLDIFRSLVTQPALVLQIAAEPARVQYLRHLAMAFGFAMLLAPEVVLLSLPVLLANLLSAYPAQYYGEFHYSAPVTAYFAVGAAYGAARLWRWAAHRTSHMSGDFQHMPAASVTTMTAVSALRNSRSALRPAVTATLSVWIVAWALVTYVEFGRGPGGGHYDVTPVDDHDRLLERFVAQIPADAAVTATAAVHPHVSHRRFVYQFPTGLESPGQADWALLDVTTATDMAPGDVRTIVESMLAGDWGVVDAAHGFLLMRKGEPNKIVPAAFYDFARVAVPDGEHADSPLAFTGVEVDDWPRWRTSTVTTHWRAGEGFDAAAMEPQIEIRSPAGETLYRFADAHPPALVWYPPELWQPGDEITVTTLPLRLPRDFGISVERKPGLSVTGAIVPSATDGADLVAAYRRGQGDHLYELPPDLARTPDWTEWFRSETGHRSTGADAVFQVPGGGQISVQARLPDRTAWPGDVVDLWLSWFGDEGWPHGMSVFAHLRQNGENVAQNDGLPRWFVRLDEMEALTSYGAANDWRQFILPENAMSADEYDTSAWTVVIGLYDPATGQRAEVYSPDGTLLGEELVVGELDAVAPPFPDQSCALIPETCASQTE